MSEIYAAFLKSTGVSTDTRSIEPGNLFFALSGPNFNGNKYAEQALRSGALAVVVDDKSVVKDERFLLVEDCLTALQDLAREHRKHWGKTVIGLTGSNGKTTTKELMQSVLKQKFNVLATKGNLNNHIGVPLTLLNLKDHHEIAIIEMGANHPKEIKALCQIALPNFGLITNIGMAHLEGFGTIEGVARSKTEMYEFLSKNKGEIFLNVDDNWLIEKAVNSKISLTYGFQQKKPDVIGVIDNKASMLTFSLSLFGKEETHQVNTRLAGSYNLPNALAAAAVGLKFDVPIADVVVGLESFVPDNNRSQIELIKGVTFILDAYNANPSSVKGAIENLKGQNFDGGKAIVLGDMLELGKFSEGAHSEVISLLESANFNPTIFVGKEFMKCKSIAPSSFHFFETRDELKSSLKSFSFENKMTLVKGSRGIGLDKFPEWI